MNWKLLLLGAALAGALVVGLLLLPGGARKSDTLELTILHTNDLHAHYDPFEPFGEPVQGGVARLARVIQDIRRDEANVLLLDAGDQFQGTLYFTVGGADVVASVMNRMGYDAMCVGNHEFDKGPAELARFIQQADFPVLGANINTWSDPDLSGLILPFSVHFMGGVPIGVIGLTTENTSYSSSPGPNVRFEDATETAQRTVDMLEGTGINTVIALTHLGYDRDLELASSVAGIDIVVGGHSHTSLGSDYPVEISSPTGEPVLVVTASDWGRVLGRLDVTFSSDGVIEAYSGELFPIDETVPEDPEMLAVLEPYQDGIAALMSQSVGTTSVLLNGERDDVRSAETNLGNLICDAMLWKTSAFETNIALQNGGGIRASILEGTITMGEVLEVLPYGNQITILELTGQAIWDALENGVSEVEDDGGRFPQVAGLRFTYDAAAEPGTRIVSIDVMNADDGSFAAIDRTARYKVATNSFLASGGDGYDRFATCTDRYETGWLLSDALAEYLEMASPVAPAIEERITEEKAG